VCQRPVLEVGDDLLDDRVGAVRLLGVDLDRRLGVIGDPSDRRADRPVLAGID